MSSDKTTTLNNQTYYYEYNGGGVYFSIFDLLPETYRNARVFLYNYLLIIIWIVSILGNTLVILVLMKKRNRSFSTSIYLKGLAFADLSLNTSNNFILYLLAQGYIPPPSSETICYYGNVFPFAISFITTWMLVVISVERVISVWMPFKVKRLCTAKIAYIVNIAIWIFFIGLAFLHERVYKFKPGLGCEIKDDILLFYIDYIQWLIVSIKFLLPYFIIFMCTVIIMLTLLSRKMRKQSTERGNKGKSVNVVLIIVNVVFLVTNSPYIIFYLFAEYDTFSSNPLLSLAYYTFWHVYLRVLNELNSALNVFVYFLVGSRFRADVKEMLFGCFRKPRASTMSNSRKNLKARGTALPSNEFTAKADNSVPKTYLRQDSQFTM